MSEFKPKVSIVFPTYNEAENVKEAAERSIKACGPILHEIIYVDDNSPDGTWKIIKEMAKEDNRIKLIHRTKERGLATAIKRGVDEAKGNVIVWMDVDLALPPELVPTLVGNLDNYDICIGSRYAKGGKDARAPTRAFLSRMFNLYANIFLNFKVKDYSSGFMAVRREVLDDVPLNPVGFGEYFLDFMYRATLENKKIKEVGFHFTDRAKGTSKCDENYGQLLGHGWNFGTHILKMRLTYRRKKK